MYLIPKQQSKEHNIYQTTFKGFVCLSADLNVINFVDKVTFSVFCLCVPLLAMLAKHSVSQLIKFNII